MSEFSNIKGLNKLSKQLSSIGPEIGKRAMRSAPLGDRSHTVSKRRGQKGRLVSPGFLSRNIKKSSRFFPRKGKAVAKIKILPEAFYGAFYDVGAGKFRKTGWFTGTFISDRKQIEGIFQQVLKAYIKKFQ